MGDVRIPYASIVSVGTSNFCYRVCCRCESVLPEDGPAAASACVGGMIQCRGCKASISIRSGSGTKRLYRLQLSIALDERVTVVLAFDRAARRLLGCSADHLFEFTILNPFAAEMVDKILEGEMIETILRPPKSGRAQDMRAVSIVPLSPHFQPIISVLRKLYPTCGVRACKLEERNSEEKSGDV